MVEWESALETSLYMDSRQMSRIAKLIDEWRWRFQSSLRRLRHRDEQQLRDIELGTWTTIHCTASRNLDVVQPASQPACLPALPALRFLRLCLPCTHMHAPGMGWCGHDSARSKDEHEHGHARASIIHRPLMPPTATGSDGRRHGPLGRDTGRGREQVPCPRLIT